MKRSTFGLSLATDLNESNACTQWHPSLLTLRTLIRADRLTPEVVIHEIGHALDGYAGLQIFQARPTESYSAYYSEASEQWRCICNVLMFLRSETSNVVGHSLHVAASWKAAQFVQENAVVLATFG
jgi:hypothetical protein